MRSLACTWIGVCPCGHEASARVLRLAAHNPELHISRKVRAAVGHRGPGILGACAARRPVRGAPAAGALLRALQLLPAAPGHRRSGAGRSLLQGRVGAAAHAGVAAGPGRAGGGAERAAAPERVPLRADRGPAGLAARGARQVGGAHQRGQPRGDRSAGAGRTGGGRAQQGSPGRAGGERCRASVERGWSPVPARWGRGRRWR